MLRATDNLAEEAASIASGTANRGALLPDRSAPTGLLVLSFLTVYLLWGGTFFAMRVGVESFPPLILAGMRHFSVGLALYPPLRWKTGIKPTADQWKTAAITGLLLLCVGNGGVCWAEQTVPSGIAALLVATVTLWMVIVDWLRPGGHRPSARIVFGIVMGFAGMVILIGPSRLGLSGRVDPIGAGVLIAASLAWACGSLYSKHGTLPSSPMLGVAMQGLCGGAALWITAALNGEVVRFHPAAATVRAWMAVVYLMVFGSCIGFTAYLYILKNSTAAQVGTYAFVNPIVALIVGWLLGGEALSARTLLAAAVILTAVVLVITAPHREPREARDALPAPGEV
ncbi:MAG TPA: EamA family transporter [Candidatus Bathyarchaeia archaeon]|nr:EamA family transporter [Candidatus Bathyarchaeia archaeon]